MAATPYQGNPASGKNGIWQKIGSGDWVQQDLQDVDGAFVNTSTDFAPTAYPNSLGENVYVFDRTTGKLWARYIDTQTQTSKWKKAWTMPSADRGNITGYIAADPNNAGVVWATAWNGVGPSGQSIYHMFKLTGCQTGTCVQTYSDSVIKYPGPISISPAGNIYVASYAVSDMGAALYQYFPATGTMDNLTDGVTPYNQLGVLPQQLAISSGEQRAYVATNGDGVIVVTLGRALCAVCH